MTDNEIIKALECCKVCSAMEDCYECPYVECPTKKGCVGELIADSLDLINRQQAEIERLLQKLQQPQVEVIKEFAERLKENTIDVDVSYGYGREYYTEAVAVIEIDNLVKEMVGDTE